MHHNRLVALVTTINLGSAGYGATAANWWTSDGTDLAGAVALAAQVNLAAAVLFRKQFTSSMRWHGW